MRKYGIFMLVLSLIVVWKLWPEQPGTAAASQEGSALHLGFGLRAGGSYLVTFEQLPPFPRPPVPALATLHADGGMTATDVQTMFGNGNLALFGYRSPIHGSWRRAGDREAAFRILGFALDQTGLLGAPSLGGGSMLRTSGKLLFSEDFDRFSGRADVEIFAPGQDPLDPAETPLFTIPIAIEGRRIGVE